MSENATRLHIVGSGLHALVRYNEFCMIQSDNGRSNMDLFGRPRTLSVVDSLDMSG